jgi:glycosyltransferase involved in cell wall biosynthesis
VSQWPSFAQVQAALRESSTQHQLMVVNDVIAYYPQRIHEAMSGYARKHGIDWLRAAQSLTELDLVRQDAENKDNVILELRRANTAYLASFALFGFVIGPVNRLLGRIIERFADMAPRLGVLNQHAPRPIAPPPPYQLKTPAAAAPRIAIVTPSYQQGHFLERTIRSVLDQAYPNLAYHVQDGGSTDATLHVLRTFRGKLTWTSERDTGQTQAINRGFDEVEGDIMAWLNSDDILLPGALAYVADYFTAHPEVDVLYGHRLLIDSEDRQIGRWMVPRHNDFVLSWADYVPQETLFWRRSLWKKVGQRLDESFRFAMDWDLLLRFREAGARFVRVPRFLGGFRIHPQQKTSAAINAIGFAEMNRIRERALGRVPSNHEIGKAVLPYLIRHVAVDKWWRVRTALGARE